MDEIELVWMRNGNCRDYPPSVFFPSDGVGVDAARKICATCPVIEPCKEYALANRIDGLKRDRPTELVHQGRSMRLNPPRKGFSGSRALPRRMQWRKPRSESQSHDGFLD
mgnify:CR=1 FL=1